VDIAALSGLRASLRPSMLLYGFHYRKRHAAPCGGAMPSAAPWLHMCHPCPRRAACHPRLRRRHATPVRRRHTSMLWRHAASVIPIISSAGEQGREEHRAARPACVNTLLLPQSPLSQTPLFTRDWLPPQQPPYQTSDSAPHCRRATPPFGLLMSAPLFPLLQMLGQPNHLAAQHSA